MKSFLLRWIITTLAVQVAAQIVPGITWDTWSGLLVATLLLGLLNAFVRPVLIFFALPLVVLTLGLFIFVINALLLYWVGHSQGLSCGHFWGCVLGFGHHQRGDDGAQQPDRLQQDPALNSAAPNRPRPPPSDDGGGPMIDV